MAELQYKPITAQQVWDRMTCDDTPLYFKAHDGIYKLVDHFNTAIDGDRLICGMFDVGIEGEEYYHRIDPYSHLYLVDQATCQHENEITENADKVEYLCKVCGHREPAPLLESHPQFSELVRRLKPDAQAALQRWEAESAEFARFSVSMKAGLDNMKEAGAILKRAKELLEKAETARLAYFNLIGMG